jgi:twitching motility two-component system response regulator PilH
MISGASPTSVPLEFTQRHIGKPPEKPFAPSSYMDSPLIAIIDDEASVVRLNHSLLRRGGYQRFLFGNNGQDAVKLAKEGQPDLILMDVLMPGMNGIEALRALKKSPTTTHIPVIILSAYTHAPEKEDLVKLGAFAVLKKPYSFSALLDLIRRALAANELARAS